MTLFTLDLRPFYSVANKQQEEHANLLSINLVSRLIDERFVSVMGEYVFFEVIRPYLKLHYTFLPRITRGNSLSECCGLVSIRQHTLCHDAAPAYIVEPC